MASLIDHVNQSKHNKKIASQLMTNPDTRDWAITAAFYSALHRVSAGLEFKGISLKIDTTGENPGLHKQRIEKIRNVFSKDCFIAYKKLYSASLLVRYIENCSGSTHIPSHSYYDHSAAKSLLENDLRTVYQEIVKAAPGAKD